MAGLDSNAVKLILAGVLVFVVLKVLGGKDGYTPFDYTDTATYGQFKPSAGTASGPAGSAAGAAAAADDAAVVGRGLASGLLPKPPQQPSDFAEFAPKPLQGANFVDPSRFTGINTQGSSLKNANYQLRADPPIPRTAAWGPIYNSTIEPDLLRKPIE